MTGRIAIFCNGTVPGMGVPNGAQGLRAYGLSLGLRAHGCDVDIVCAANAIHAQLDKWDYDVPALPAHVRVLPREVLQERLDSDYGTVVILNWAALPEYIKPEGVRLVYDFFSPTMVEHSFIAEPDELARREAKKHALLAQADLFIANGSGRASYGRNFLAGSAVGGQTVSSVRLALPWGGDTTPPPGAPFRLFLGGYDQAWTKGLTLADLHHLATACDAEVHTIGFGQHLHMQGTRFAARADMARDPSGRVVHHQVKPYAEFARINAGCHVALDVFEANDERRLSYSTRAITALANGCPLITMGFTEIGRLVAKTGAGWVLRDYSRDAVEALLTRLRHAPDEVAEKRRNTRAFWQAYCAPASQARPLARKLS